MYMLYWKLGNGQECNQDYVTMANIHIRRRLSEDKLIVAKEWLKQNLTKEMLLANYVRVSL